MPAERSNWVRDTLPGLGIDDQEAEAARKSLLDRMEQDKAEKRKLQEKIADLTRRVEQLEKRKLEQGN